ncbi:MAG: hypothetical protein AAFQ27_13430 [Pseudomonadota bacterium]
MSRANIPDWGSPIHGPQSGFYRRANGGDGCVGIPTAVALDDKSERVPLSLTLFRRNDDGDLDSAGRLNLHWRLAYSDLEEVERSSGRRMPRPISRALPQGGSLRLYPLLEEINLPASLRREITLNATGNTRGPAIHRVESHDAEFMAGLLEGQTMPLGLFGQVGVVGQSPLFKAQVSVDRNRAVKALERMASETGEIADRDLVELLATKLPAGISVEGKVPRGPRRRIFGEALRDRLAQALLVPAPPYSIESGACWRLRDHEEHSSTLHFDLSKRTLCLRVFASRFDIGTALQSFEKTELVNRKTVDAIPRHGRTITVLANLPEKPEGVLEWGVNLRVPPAAPHRPQAINKTLSSLASNSEPIELELKIGPNETLAYEVSGYAVTMRGSEFGQKETDPVAVKSDILIVSPDLMPIATRGFQASEQLAKAGTLTLTGWENETVVETIDWPTGAEELSVWSDAGENASYRIELSGSDRSVTSQAFEADGGILDFHLFAEFGSRSTKLTIDLADGEHCAIDIKGEDEDTATTLAFSGSRTEREYTWFCSNPLRGGLLIRSHGDEDWQTFSSLDETIDLGPSCNPAEPVQ